MKMDDASAHAWLVGVNSLQRIADQYGSLTSGVTTSGPGRPVVIFLRSDEDQIGSRLAEFRSSAERVAVDHGLDLTYRFGMRYSLEQLRSFQSEANRSRDRLLNVPIIGTSINVQKNKVVLYVDKPSLAEAELPDRYLDIAVIEAAEIGDD